MKSSLPCSQAGEEEVVGISVEVGDGIEVVVGIETKVSVGKEPGIGIEAMVDFMVGMTRCGNLSPSNIILRVKKIPPRASASANPQRGWRFVGKEDR